MQEQMTRRVGGFVTLMVMMFLSVMPGMAANPSEDLAQALSQAEPGQVITLAPGDYGKLSVADLVGAPAAPITLRGADPTSPPRFSRLTLRNSRHIVLEDIALAHHFTVGDPTWFRPFQVLGGGNITFRRVTITGDVAHDMGPGKDGFPTAYGLGIRNVDGFRLEDSEVTGFARGLIVGQSRDLVVLRNDFHGFRSDGMNFAQVSQLLVEDNLIRDFTTSAESGDHPDMIQFWTNGTKAPSTDITIRNNVLNSGHGGYTQSIFMRNEEVDTGRAGREMYYRNITIEDNVIINAHLHGITVGEADGVIIRDNTIIHNALSDGEADNPPLWNPRISVKSAANNVRIERNVVSRIAGYEHQPDWELRDNYLVQDRTRAKSGFYGAVFANPFKGDPRDLSSFFYKKGGPLDGIKIGARRLWAR